MYLIFRCDCGRAVYAKEGVNVKKCVCGKNLKVAQRRIIAKTEDHQTASEKRCQDLARSMVEPTLLLPINYEPITYNLHLNHSI